MAEVGKNGSTNIAPTPTSSQLLQASWIDLKTEVLERKKEIDAGANPNVNVDHVPAHTHPEGELHPPVTKDRVKFIESPGLSDDDFEDSHAPSTTSLATSSYVLTSFTEKPFIQGESVTATSSSSSLLIEPSSNSSAAEAEASLSSSSPSPAVNPNPHQEQQRTSPFQPVTSPTLLSTTPPTSTLATSTPTTDLPSSFSSYMPSPYAILSSSSSASSSASSASSTSPSSPSWLPSWLQKAASHPLTPAVLGACAGFVIGALWQSWRTPALTAAAAASSSRKALEQTATAAATSTISWEKALADKDKEIARLSSLLERYLSAPVVVKITGA